MFPSKFSQKENIFAEVVSANSTHVHNGSRLYPNQHNTLGANTSNLRIRLITSSPFHPTHNLTRSQSRRHQAQLSHPVPHTMRLLNLSPGKIRNHTWAFVVLVPGKQLKSVIGMIGLMEGFFGNPASDSVGGGGSTAKEPHISFGAHITAKRRPIVSGERPS